MLACANCFSVKTFILEDYVIPKESGGHANFHAGVGPNKEWKPKTTNANPAQAPATAAASDILPNPAVAVTWSLEASSSVTTEEAALKVEKKLADLQLLDRQHVIIPDHLQVPESERYGLSFGSFDAGFEITTANGPASDKYSVPSDSELSQGIEGTVEEPFSRLVIF